MNDNLCSVKLLLGCNFSWFGSTSALLGGANQIKREVIFTYWLCLLSHSPGCPVVPKYYYVPADFVELEKKSPGSQRRFPSNSGRDGKLFLWGQAVYIIAKLLGESWAPAAAGHSVPSCSSWVWTAFWLEFQMDLEWLMCPLLWYLCDRQKLPCSGFFFFYAAYYKA